MHSDIAHLSMLNLTVALFDLPAAGLGLLRFVPSSDCSNGSGGRELVSERAVEIKRLPAF